MSEINSVQTHDGGTITGNMASAEDMAEAFSKAPEASAEPEPALVEGEPTLDPAGEPEAPVKRSEAKKDMKARMLEATQKEAAAKKRADEVEQRAIRAENELRSFRERMPPATELTKTAPKPAAADSTDPEPKEDDFASYGEYVVAAGRWAARQEHAEIGKKTEAEQRKAGFRDFQINQVKKFNERVSERAKTEPNLELPADVVSLLPQKPFDLDHQMNSDDLIGAYFTSEERGLDLMVYFKDHLDELGRIRALSPGRVPIELARIEGRLNGATTASPAKPEVIRASPPVRPVTAAPPSVDDPNALPDATLSTADWVKKREALEERRFKAGRR